MSMSIFNSSLPTPEANIFALLKPVKTHYMHIKPGLRSRGKNDTDLAPVSELFFHEHGSGSSSGALDFYVCGSRSGSGARVFHGSGFCLFSHIHILIILMCLKLSKMI